MFVLGLDWRVRHDVVHLVVLLLLALVLALLPYLLGLLPHLLGLAMLLAAHLLDLAMLHAVRLLELDLAMLLAVTPPEAGPGSAGRCSPWGSGDMLLATNNIFVLSIHPCNLHDSDRGGSEQYSSVVSTVGGLPVRGIFGGGVESSISSVREGFSSYSGRS